MCQCGRDKIVYRCYHGGCQDNKNFCVLIDKKKLSYHKNQLDMKTLQVIQIFMKASNDFFTGDGSIMYGKLSQQNNSYVLDVLLLFFLIYFHSVSNILKQFYIFC